MTTAEMLFGSGSLAPSNAAWGRVLGIARQTVGEKIRNPGRLTLDELAAIAAARDMTAEEVGKAVIAWRKEGAKARVERRRA